MLEQVICSLTYPTSRQRKSSKLIISQFQENQSRGQKCYFERQVKLIEGTTQAQFRHTDFLMQFGRGYKQKNLDQDQLCISATAYILRTKKAPIVRLGLSKYLVGISRLELLTSTMSRQRSNQLSYTPIQVEYSIKFLLLCKPFFQ